MKMKFTDLKIDKGKERGQIQHISCHNIAKKVAGSLASPPQGPLHVTAWEDSSMNRSAYLHNVNNISAVCYAVLHDSHCR